MWIKIIIIIIIIILWYSNMTKKWLYKYRIQIWIQIQSKIDLKYSNK
jgi:hypothetical protein